ncbi:uncharacterized protein N7482_008198 [Penicillium canariense]|uniref:Uncharacterized protein n=1 Tax=Penicillium canariense TaxID=189055 RepID=A0A9W9HUT7_9EURO|nr:uncharacterized protein N7482_008198 [Penicillium canariense]KAJ5157098.1 hypothetical protein N7482_008198 [Penicillium canariense]
MDSLYSLYSTARAKGCYEDPSPSRYVVQWHRPPRRAAEFTVRILGSRRGAPTPASNQVDQIDPNSSGVAGLGNDFIVRLHGPASENKAPRTHHQQEDRFRRSLLRRFTGAFGPARYLRGASEETANLLSIFWLDLTRIDWN